MLKAIKKTLFAHSYYGSQDKINHVILSNVARLNVSSRTAISRKVVGKAIQATIPKGNMGYDQ